MDFDCHDRDEQDSLLDLYLRAMESAGSSQAERAMERTDSSQAEAA
jgi:hypothetical protein